MTRPRTLVRGAIALLLAVTSATFVAGAAHAVTGGPRTFNLYIRNHYEPGDAAILAKYDALGLDVDTPVSTLNEIKALNPDIKLLAYIPINGTYQAAPLFPAGSKWREMYEAAENNNWWLLDTQGGHVFDHAKKYTINISTVCPPNASGQTMLDWYPEFIVDSILENGASVWDGVILDDVWVGIWFINNNAELNDYPIDADQDGVAEDQPTLDLWWRAGNDTITSRIARTLPPGKILTGNGGNPFYHMNGAMIEDFPNRGSAEPGHPLGYTWNDKMFGPLGYFNNETYYSDQPERMNFNNAKWDYGDRYNPDRSPEFGRHLRFTLASTMLRDGYYSVDWRQPTAGHHSLWWEPEMEKPIGTPTGAPYQVTYGGMTLWRRDYTNGSVIVNHNYTTFPGSPANGIPPIGWVDARILLTNEFWTPESTPPGTIDDLLVTRTWFDRIEVQWTNVGDNGDEGQAVQVEVRYSTSPITGANWSSAAVAPGSIVPQLPGISQLQILTGLTQNTTYYVAAKTKDMAGNWSAVSNVVSATTVISDITPPSPVTNLSVMSTHSTGARVRWTSTGDDGLLGLATSFDLRYATFPLNATNFASGAAVVGEPTPGPAGTVHEMDLHGMIPYTTYYFAIKVGDEMPNWSLISNVPTGTTLAGDITPPADIVDLRVIAVGTDNVTLQWTSPGDDGNVGRANQYDLRFSPNLMTPSNFLQANYLSGEPGPQNAGTVQTMTVSGLGINYTYSFGIRTADEFPNWSGPSNFVRVTTNQPLPNDTTPPAAVTDLRVTGTTTTSISVAWTAPGDDGNTGTALSYDLRYSTAAITSSNFSTATMVSGEPLPAAAGTTQGMTISGLQSGVQYHLALKTADELANWSSVSNVPTGITLLTIDTTPPAAITNLTVTGQAQNSISLTWTAPGDDGSTGIATSYDLRYSTSAITAANFSAATAVSGEPTPGSPGTTQGMTVSGLTAGTTYHFAMKTADEVPNWSTISNVPSGATSPATPPPDTTPPAAIANLALTGQTQNSITLSWTAPGDDGSTGTATSYDLRYSTAAITAANFGSATAATGEPAPATPGSTQGMTVSGLTAGTTYHFALKTADEVPNWAAISNVPNGTTAAAPPPPDTTPPAAIANLAITGQTQNSITLSWTAPGDDGSTGTATSYDLRYSTSAITAGNFAAATAVTGEPAPATPGTTQGMTVSGLTAGTTYHFALKTADEVPNWAAISNVPNGTTAAAPPPPDTTPPAAIANLAITGQTQNSITLSWTAPGDDGATGTATSYDLRYSTSAITAGNFAAATAATGEPAPATPGTTQGMTVSGLTAGTTYYFALKTADEVPNWAAISNVPNGATAAVPPPADTTPPAAIANLTVTGQTQNSMTITWTAPGDDGTTGTATSYDLRYSTSAITAGNFAAATAVGNQPTPAASGTPQGMTVSGLSAGTTYYFAIKAADEVPNWAAISNVPSGTTASAPPPPDTTPPAAIANLAITGQTQNSISLSWTSPGDDGTTGTATTYDLRYSTSAITAANFASATAVNGEPSPLVAGTTQTMTVGGLSAGTTYHFALKAADEVPNWAAISNAPSGATVAAPPGDTTPPAAIANLAQSASTVNTITFSWTSPGDDGSTGTATSYDFRWSTSPITAANYASATQSTGEPTPAPAGTQQSLTLTGLPSGLTVYAAIKAADEVPNWSGLSNVASGATLPPPDTTPPAGITNLLVTGVTQTSVTLSWTAPGDDAATGTAAQYDLRHRSSSITSANFGSSTQVTGEPEPAVAGTPQSMTVTGLSAGTTYFFAMRTADEKPNWSILSNVVSTATSPPADTTPPATTASLALVSTTPTSVSVSWIAPGDDGTIGVATTYDVRISTAPITGANFAGATPVQGAPTPALAGTAQSMIISGLSASTTYFVALKTADEVPNWSALSNVLSAATPAAPDVTPPAAVTDLTVGGTGATAVMLHWTAPGDDGASGNATAYDLRYSTNPITAANFGTASQAIGEPTPGSPGTSESLTVSGLTAGTPYWFALRTRDDVTNWSALSNVATAQTLPPPDVIAPSPVTSLEVTTVSTTALHLAWSTPGDDGSTGTAAAYDIRYSTAPLTEADFTSATVVSPVPTPSPAGSRQTVTVDGLTPGRDYWFALKSVDDAGNWSGLSNVAPGRTADATDVLPPAAVTSLLVTGTTATGTMTVSWTAPGGDGQVGMAAAYDVRVSAATITAATFASDPIAAGAPPPSAPGSTETMTLTGLSPGTRHWVAVKTVDAAGNWSNLSNVVSALIPLPPDIIAPAAVALQTVHADTESVVLAWIASGDDGAAGRASNYELRWGVGLPGPGGPGEGTLAMLTPPAAAGTSESVTLSGFEATQTYWFALRVADEVPNWSPWSPIHQVTMLDSWTPPATSPPLAPSGVSAAVVSGGIRISWNRNLEPDLAGYHVYRRSGLGAWHRLTPLPTPHTTLVDSLAARSGVYEYRVTALNVRGEEGAPSATVFVDIRNPGTADHLLQLSSASPNPFTANTCVRLSVPADGLETARATVVDIRGRVVRVLLDATLTEGETLIEWDGRDSGGAQTPAGVYFLIVETREGISSRKLVRAR